MKAWYPNLFVAFLLVAFLVYDLVTKRWGLAIFQGVLILVNIVASLVFWVMSRDLR